MTVIDSYSEASVSCLVDEQSLTPRQQSERAFYDRFAGLNSPKNIDFSPVMGVQRRPWNSYWQMYHHALYLYENGARTVLDFGCGMGTSSIRLARIGYYVEGFDISHQCVQTAQQVAASYGLGEQAHFRTAVAEDLPYPDSSFDVVIGFDILHHVEIPAAIGQVMRVLRPEGVALFREHIRVPAVDALRDSWLGCRIVPKGPSLTRNVTEHERKLHTGDLRAIEAAAGHMTIDRYNLLSRFDVLLQKARIRNSASRLEKIDAALFRICPPLRRLGDGAIIIAHKS